MALSLHTIKPAKGSKKTRVRVGRGDASGAGSYSGRGMKGQRARSGGKGGLKLKGIKANIQNLPKFSGMKSKAPRVESVNISNLDKNFKKGDVVTAATLAAKGLITSPTALVKVLGDGKLSKALTVRVNRASASAAEAITKAGGKVFLNPQYSGKGGVKKEVSKSEETPKEENKEVATTKKKTTKKTSAAKKPAAKKS